MILRAVDEYEGFPHRLMKGVIAVKDNLAGKVPNSYIPHTSRNRRHNYLKLND